MSTNPRLSVAAVYGLHCVVSFTIMAGFSLTSGCSHQGHPNARPPVTGRQESISNYPQLQHDYAVIDEISVEQVVHDWDRGLRRSLSLIELLRESLDSATRLLSVLQNAEAVLPDWQAVELELLRTIDESFDNSKDELYYYSFRDRRGEDEAGGQEQGYLVLRAGEIRNEYPIAGNLRDVDRIWNSDAPRLRAAKEDGKQSRTEAVIPRQPIQGSRTVSNIARSNSFTNSLGMTLVPVPIANRKLLFSQLETRVADYTTFVEATSRQWQKPSFKQLPSHPAVNVTWLDAEAFCAWLTERERSQGWIRPWQEYRLPTDVEWSRAVGLAVEAGRTPAERQRAGTRSYFPWGGSWPPPMECGNYGVDIAVDAFTNTSPAGSFRPNVFGLYDLGGNVWEWCQDWSDRESEARLLRGGSWDSSDMESLQASYRLSMRPVWASERFGFRCVLLLEREPPPRLESQKEQFFSRHPNLRDYYLAFDEASLAMLEARIRDDYSRRAAIVLATKEAISGGADLAVLLSKMEDKLRTEEKAYSELLREIQRARDSAWIKLYYYISKESEDPSQGLLVVRDGRVDKKFPIKRTGIRRN